MLVPMNAEVQRQRHFFSCMRTSIFSYLTSRWSSRSDLLPTRRTTAVDSPQVSSSLNQFLRCSNERLLVRSKAMMTPSAERQQAAVMARKRYCPAVSQIWVLMIILSMMKVLMASSTPMVGFDSSLKVLSVNFVRMFVLPTPESPTMISLNMKSGSMCSDIGQLQHSQLLLIAALPPHLSEPDFMQKCRWVKAQGNQYFQILRMSLRGTGGLFNIVAKEIRKKHLEEDIKYAENRGKSRSCKLKDHYQIPLSNNHTIYLYSNVHGNQFILKEHAFDNLDIHSKPDAVEAIRQIHSKINKSIYDLWVKKKEFSRTPYFAQNQQIISISTILVVILFFVGCFVGPLSQRLLSNEVVETIERHIYKAILSAIMLLLIICGVALARSLNKDYEAFNYDRQVVNSLIGLLSREEERVLKLGLHIQADKEMTWIRFRAAPTHEVQVSEDSEEQELPVFIESNSRNSEDNSVGSK